MATSGYATSCPRRTSCRCEYSLARVIWGDGSMHGSPGLTCNMCCTQARAFLLQALGQADGPSSEKRKQIGLISKQHLALSAPVLAVLESHSFLTLWDS